MYSEFEIIKHPVIQHVNIFLVNMEYRTSHLHRDFEINLILEGNLEILDKNRRYTVSADEIVIFNMNQPHELKCLNENALILCLQVSPKVWVEYYPLITSLVFDDNRVANHLSQFNFNVLKELFTELAHSYYDSSANVFYFLSILNSLFTILQRLPHHYLSTDEKARETRRVERLNRILGYAEENYMYNIRLSDVAERERLTLSYLSHFFKENLNQSFQQYIMSLRLNRAKQLILSGNSNLLNICLECGFSDYRYLLKAFQKVYGCTPEEYRKLHEKADNFTPSSKITLEYIFPDRSAQDIISQLRNRLIEGSG